ncbi:type II secretion system protein [Demequina rhizosphaerae]|uniref:type II secretion system protein n=1 Tax=Demequina rhizosphaerae TaxID=1638985 RepID=UPI000780E1C1|nr:prepilin-type N-terminal cleavage/methylation domain-containing protein [Demequina rhizosphaerae]
MIARIQKSMEKRDAGFTLIELLVVMIIIGILAAIAIPLFLNQRKKAEDSAAKADVSTLGKEIATYFVDNDDETFTIADGTGRYVMSGGDITGTQDLGKVSKNVELTDLDVTDSQTWCVEVTNDQGDKQVFSYSSASGLYDGTCAAGPTT